MIASEPSASVFAAATDRWAALSAIALAVSVYLATASLPLFGDANSWFRTVAAWPSPLSAFDPELAVWRPLQMGLLWLLAALDGDRAAFVRIPGLLLHVGVVVMLLRLARTLGVAASGRLWVAGLLLCFPATVALSWSVAAHTPGRVLFVLWVIEVAVRHARRPSASTGVAMLALAGIAAMWHETGVVAFGAAIVTVAAVARQPLVELLRDRWLQGLALVGVMLAAFLLLRSGRVHGAIESAALPANAARTLLVFMPEPLRLWALDALRGDLGAGAAFGGAALAALPMVGLAFWWRRGTRVERLLLAIAVADLVVAMLMSGMTGRYAYGAAALVAVAAGLLWQRATMAPQRIGFAVCVGALAALLLVDAVSDLREVRQGGRLIAAIASQAAAARAEAGDTELILVDLPANHGREREIAMLSWGAVEALRRGGVPGPVQCVRTRHPGTSTDQPVVSVAELAAMVRRWPASVWVFDAAAGRLVPGVEATAGRR